MELTYQQRVLLAVYDIAKEDPDVRKYEFQCYGEALLILPRFNAGKGTDKLMFVTVTDNRVVGSDRDLVAQIESRLKPEVEDIEA